MSAKPTISGSECSTPIVKISLFYWVFYVERALDLLILKKGCRLKAYFCLFLLNWMLRGLIECHSGRKKSNVGG